MTRVMKGLFISVDGPPREVDLPDDDSNRFMNSLRRLIGTDCAERIWVTDRWEAWVDEDGGAAERPVNQAATRLVQSFGRDFLILGPVVIIGLDEDTLPVALSPDQVGAILERIGAPAS